MIFEMGELETLIFQFAIVWLLRRSQNRTYADVNVVWDFGWEGYCIDSIDLSDQILSSC